MPTSLSDLHFISSVAERDVDFIILEELEVSEEFRTWFATRVFELPIFKQRIGAWHSVSDPELGESDLVFLIEATDGSRKAILVENKIAAPPQPAQAKRYKHRGEKGLTEGNWDEFRTCIIAPRRYLSSSKNSGIYDTEVSYEEIMAYFLSHSIRDARFAYRASLIQEAIEQNRRGYQPKLSEPMTAFVQDYVAYAGEASPGLNVEKAKPRPAGSTWIMFYPKGLSKENQVTHQLTAGFVKFMVGGKANELDFYRKKYSECGIDDLKVQAAGKSIGLVLEVSQVDPLTEKFADTLSRATDALHKLETLVSVAKEHGDL